MRSTVLAILAAATVASPCTAVESTPADIVRTFVAMLAHDKIAAGTMIAEDAQFGAGDVGGEFDIAFLDMLAKDCSFDVVTAPATRPLEMEGRAITLVEAAMSCEVDGQSLSSLPIEFLVERGKIAGLYVPIKSGPMELSGPTESENDN